MKLIFKGQWFYLVCLSQVSSGEGGAKIWSPEKINRASLCKHAHIQQLQIVEHGDPQKINCARFCMHVHIQQIVEHWTNEFKHHDVKMDTIMLEYEEKHHCVYFVLSMRDSLHICGYVLGTMRSPPYILQVPNTYNPKYHFSFEFNGRWIETLSSPICTINIPVWESSVPIFHPISARWK